LLLRALKVLLDYNPAAIACCCALLPATTSNGRVGLCAGGGNEKRQSGAVTGVVGWQ